MKKIFRPGFIDLFIGLFAGIIVEVSVIAYLILLALAIFGASLMWGLGMSFSFYGEDERGKFKWSIVFLRGILVNVGVIIGRTIITTVI